MVDVANTPAPSGAAKLCKKAGQCAGALIVDSLESDLGFLDEAARFHNTAETSRSYPRMSLGTHPVLQNETHVLLFLPKGVRRRDYLFDALTHQLKSRPLVVVGPRKGGIKAARKVLEKRFATVTVGGIGNHCQLLIARDSNESTEKPLTDYERRWSTGLGFDATSYPGTFAEGRLDTATQLLIKAILEPKVRSNTRVLDLGCGSGVLGLALKQQQPAIRLTLADADHLAVAAAKRTTSISELGEEDVTVVASHGYSKLEGRFDLIVTNPPFHQGVQTNLEVPEMMIAGAPKHLRKGGQFWLVANRTLPYEKMLQTHFKTVSAVKETSSFKVLRASSPRQAM